MTGIERVKDVEQRLELPAQYQEAVEKHVPVMLAGLEERGVTFDVHRLSP